MGKKLLSSVHVRHYLFPTFAKYLQVFVVRAFRLLRALALGHCRRDEQLRIRLLF